MPVLALQTRKMIDWTYPFLLLRFQFDGCFGGFKRATQLADRGLKNRIHALGGPYSFSDPCSNSLPQCRLLTVAKQPGIFKCECRLSGDRLEQAFLLRCPFFVALNKDFAEN